MESGRRQSRTTKALPSVHQYCTYPSRITDFSLPLQTPLICFLRQNERVTTMEKIVERGQTRPADWGKTAPPLILRQSDIRSPKNQWKWRTQSRYEKRSRSTQRAHSFRERVVRWVWTSIEVSVVSFSFSLDISCTSYILQCHPFVYGRDYYWYILYKIPW